MENIPLSFHIEEQKKGMLVLEIGIPFTFDFASSTIVLSVIVLTDPPFLR